MGQELLPYRVLVPSRLQVAHIGLKGGLHETSITKQKRERMTAMKNMKPFHDKPLPGNIAQFQSQLVPHVSGFGGWGHPADQNHCMELFGEK